MSEGAGCTSSYIGENQREDYHFPGKKSFTHSHQVSVGCMLSRPENGSTIALEQLTKQNDGMRGMQVQDLMRSSLSRKDLKIENNESGNY